MTRNPLTPALRAQVDQEMAQLDTRIDTMLAALRMAPDEIDAEPGLAVTMLISRMDGLPLFNVKALAARLLVRLSQTEVAP